MIRAIIVEDDPIHQKNLRDQLDNFVVPVTILAICSTVETAYQAITAQQPDLIFLDIDLGNNETGFDLLKLFNKPDFSVIFTTQHNNSSNAISAIRACALDFLPKPLLPEELENALTRFNENRPGGIAQTISLTQNIESPNSEIHEIWIAGTEGRTRIMVNNIHYCESDNYATTFYLLEPVNKRQSIISSLSIKEWEKILGNSSITRIHNEYLANLAYASKYKPHGNGGKLTLTQGVELNVSKSRKEALIDRLKL